MIAPRRIGAYVQSKGTVAGFDRMKRRGIVLPPFQVEQQTAKAIRIGFDKFIAKIESITVSKSLQTGVGVGDAEPVEIDPQILIKSLREEIKGWQEANVDPWSKYFTNVLRQQLDEAMRSFFYDFLDDAPVKLANRIAVALDRDEVFKGRLETMKSSYLTEAVKAIGAGQSDLRKDFITKLNAWVTGKDETLEGLQGIMEGIKKESVTFSKYFARDQLSRFNAALAVASYEQGGVTHVKWVTVGDARVRKAHRDRNGKVYKITEIPERGYNCRCGLLPAKYSKSAIDNDAAYP